MTKHLFALSVQKKIYRDNESFVMTDEEFEALMQGRPLPPSFLAYHSDGERHWAEVMKLPVIRSGTIREQIEKLMPILCTQCWGAPAITGKNMCKECADVF